MKRIFSLLLALIALNTLAGCGTKPRASETVSGVSPQTSQSQANFQDKETPSDESSGASTNALASSDYGGRDTKAVPLVANWPKEVPVIDGTIHISMQNSATADSGFSTQVITKKNVKEIIDFYLSKYSKVTDEPMKTTDAKELNSCTGIIGDWKVMVTGNEEVSDGQATGNYVASILVMKNAA